MLRQTTTEIMQNMFYFHFICETLKTVGLSLDTFRYIRAYIGDTWASHRCDSHRVHYNQNFYVSRKNVMIRQLW